MGGRIGQPFKWGYLSEDRIADATGDGSKSRPILWHQQPLMIEGAST